MDKATPTLRQRCDTALQSLPDAPYRAMLAALFDEMLAEVERLAAQAAPTEAPQEFESAQGRALASAWAEGWTQCRDAEYVGEEAQSEAFNQSYTLAQCLHADQTRLQGGLSNDQLRRAWGAKLPRVIPTDEQLTAFALGIEAAAQPSAQAERAPVVQAVQTEVRFKYESMKPIDGYDAIYAEYATTFGRYPDDFMSKVVRQTKEDLFMWWGAHREKIRAGLVLLAAQEDASSGATTQAVRMLTAEEIKALTAMVWGAPCSGHDLAVFTSAVKAMEALRPGERPMDPADGGRLLEVDACGDPMPSGRTIPPSGVIGGAA